MEHYSVYWPLKVSNHNHTHIYTNVHTYDRTVCFHLRTTAQQVKTTYFSLSLCHTFIYSLKKYLLNPMLYQDFRTLMCMNQKEKKSLFLQIPLGEDRGRQSDKYKLSTGSECHDEK